MHLLLVCLAAVVIATGALPTNPVQILKQIDQANEDGSRTFGFESADGTFRVERRDKNGSVKGKYGYVDETGDVKVVEYTAGGTEGFHPTGRHLPVADVPVEALVQGQRTADALASPSSDENGNDAEWQSVDADEDGIPDFAPVFRPVVPLAPGLPVLPAGTASLNGDQVRVPVPVAQPPQSIQQLPSAVHPQAVQFLLDQNTQQRNFQQTIFQLGPNGQLVPLNFLPQQFPF